MSQVAITEHGHVAAGVQPGQILLGKYRIERVLGMGGMGVVVAATHVTLEERVAIKFLLPEALANPEAVARFLREARAAVRIKSEHVARVTDVGTLETTAPYMIMEYLDGQDLGSLSKSRGALPIEEAVEYLLQACEAIAEAHALGIVHRDLKPSNLFVVMRADGTPSVKVLDFGISKVTGMGASGADLAMTKTTTIMGSPLYMSPEQMASSRDVNAQTDVWALGAILFELLTARVPFQADTITQLCAMILQQRADPLRNHRPDAPETLQNVINRCLEKERALRFANVAELANALTPFASRRARMSIERVSRVARAAGMSSSASILDANPSSRMGGATAASWGSTGARSAKGGVRIAVVVGLLLLAGLVVAGVLVLRPKTTPAVASTTTGPVAPLAVTPVPTTPVAEPSVPVAPRVLPAAATIPSASPAAKPAANPAKTSATKVAAAKPKTAAAAAAPAPPPVAPKQPGKKSDLYGDRK